MHITEPARQTPLHGEYDVVVLGGGPAGLLAAASAARNGASVLLVERYGFLGGMGTAAGVSNFCGLHANVHGTIRQVVHGMTDELLDRMRALDGLNEPHLILGKIHAQAYDISAFKCAADGLLRDSGAGVLFHALATGMARGADGDVDTLFLETSRAAARCAAASSSTAPATPTWRPGPACPLKGRRPRRHALSHADVQGRQRRRRAGAGSLEDHTGADGRGRRQRRIHLPAPGAIVRPQKHDYEWRVNVTQLADADGGAADGTDAESLSAGELEGRRQIVQYLAFLRAKVPGFEQAYVLDIAPQLGIRETRRIVGEYMLTQDDVLGCADFDDSIGVNGWPLEMHMAGDVKWLWPPIPESRGYNQLPYRMMLPRRGAGAARNVLVAGRCASMTHEGQSAARVSGSCFAMGEAAEPRRRWR